MPNPETHPADVLVELVDSFRCLNGKTNFHLLDAFNHAEVVIAGYDPWIVARELFPHGDDLFYDRLIHDRTKFPYASAHDTHYKLRQYAKTPQGEVIQKVMEIQHESVEPE